MIEDAPELLTRVRGELACAVRDAHHPWHWPALAVAHTARVVVLRGFGPDRLAWRFFTDARSAKVSQLDASGGRCEGLFYDHDARLQLRLTGAARVLADAETEAAWAGLSAKSRSAYATDAPPGTPLARAGRGLGAGWQRGEPSEDELAAARAHFLAYEVETDRYDVLQLGRSGNRRAVGSAADGSDLQWVTP